MTNQRGKWEIILEILRGVSEEEKEGGKVKKTRVMQKACLDWRSFQKYFHFLLEHGFVGSDKPGGSKGYYLTERGRDLMNRLGEVEGILQETFSFKL
jgi:predicted transcriptional regulator